MSKRKKILIILGVICFLLLLGFCIYGCFYYQNRVQEKNKALDALEQEMASSFLEYDSKIEYGDVWDYATFLKNLTNFSEDLSITLLVNNKVLNPEDSYSFFEVGENTVTITIKKDYTYKIFKTYTSKVTKDKTFTLIVEDTIKPEISGVKDRTINVGDSIDLKKGISASDKVDGDVDVEIIGEVDTEKAGTYTIIAKATDKNGNVTEEKFNITVKKKATTSKPKSSSTVSSTASSSKNDASTKAGRLNLAKAEAKKVVEKIIKPGMSEMEKAEAIFTYLRTNVRTQSNQSNEAYKTNYGNEAYAALVLKIAACSGFCKAVTLLCNEAGLKAEHVNANKWTHQWNKVLIDGKWYIIDAQGGYFGEPFESGIWYL